MVDEYGLIGRGIGHSFSAEFFNEKFRRDKISAYYSLFELPEIDRLPALLEKHPGLKGLNVTSPYKREVIPYLHSLSPTAKQLEAVNVVKIHRDPDGKLILTGHNTDSPGFGKTLETIVPKIAKRAVILGTGGAASAVKLALQNAGINFTQVSRTPDGVTVGYDEINDSLRDYDLIINATPLGMGAHKDECPPLDYDKIGEGTVCYDLIYNPPLTLFLKKAVERGATAVNGLEMLHNQALLAWDIWSAPE